jgi:hypothetical protein
MSMVGYLYDDIDIEKERSQAAAHCSIYAGVWKGERQIQNSVQFCLQEFVSAALCL